VNSIKISISQFRWL